MIIENGKHKRKLRQIFIAADFEAPNLSLLSHKKERVLRHKGQGSRFKSE
jgi:hypothetical protein